MRHHFRRGARVARIATELCLILVCLALVGLLAGVLRLRQGPVDAGFARGYVERALGGDGYAIVVDGLTLSWPRLGSAVLLDLTNFRLNVNGQPAVSIDRAQFGLSRVLLLAGRVAPVTITLTRPELQVSRDTGNHFALSMDRAAPSVQPASQDAFAAVIRTLAAQRRLFDFGNPLAHLRRFDIQDAELTVADRIAGQRWHLSHANVTFTHNRLGLAIAARVHVPGGQHGDAIVDAAASYRRATADYLVHARVAGFDPALLSRQAPWLAPLAVQEVTLNGDVDGRLDAALGVQQLRVTLAAGPGLLGLPALYSRPLAFDGLGVDAGYDRARGLLDLNRLEVRSQGVTATLTGRFATSGAQLRGRATLGIPLVPQSAIAALWPDKIVGAGQDWLTHRLSGGALKNIDAAVAVTTDLTPDRPFALHLADVTADFDAADMTVDYRAPLAPATQADGHGRFANGALSIAVQKARIGAIAASGGQVTVTGLPGKGQATVDLQLAGPVQAALAYISSPPLGLDAKKLGFDLSALHGDAAVGLHLDFPTGQTVTAAQVAVKVDGALSHVVLPNAFHSADLTADRLALQADNAGMAFQGAGRLGGAPLTLDWRRNFGGQATLMHLVATLASDDALRARLGLDPAVRAHGAVPVKIDYTEQADGTATAALSADAGAAALEIPGLGYKKSAGAPATVAATATLRGGQLTALHDIRVAAPNFSLANGAATFAAAAGTPTGKPVLRSLRIDRLRLNETDVAVRLDPGAAGARLLTVKGAFFDARPFLARSSDRAPYRGPPLQGDVTVAALRAGAATVIRNAAARFTVDGQGMLSGFDVRGTAGQGQLTARLVAAPHGGRDLAIRAADAGAALQAFDLYPNAVGGTLTVNAHAPPDAPWTMDGKARLNDFNVVHAPVLASIFTALSLGGLPDMLEGNGIHFSSLDADFTWRAAPGGNLITVRDGRSTGASLGLTFSGDIDTAQNAVDIHGDVVPFSGINGMLNNVPILDDILTGGRHGGIFAATYSITGPPNAPQVHVNPLAALAPGFLRPLLFGR